MAPGWAQAQTPPPPGNTAPINQVLPQRVPQGSPLPRILPPGPPAVPGGPSFSGPPVAPQPVPAADVHIADVAVDGATAYTPAQLQKFTGGLAGAAVPLARIEAARVGILNLYRQDGYPLTTVAAAVDAAGHLRFTITEGHIVDVKLDGDIGPAGTQVLRFLKHLTSIRPIDTASLERWLLLAQDVPGVTLRAVLRPSPSEPGALSLVAQVSRAPVSGLLTSDNRAFPNTGPQEALAVLDLNSFSEFGEKTEISLYRTAGNTQTFGQAATEVFVGGSGLRVRVYGGRGEATPSDDLRQIGYHGFTTTFGVSALYPLIRARQQTLNLSAYLDAIEEEIRSNSGANGASVRASRDSLRVFRFGADYALQDVVLGGARPAINGISVRISQGAPFLGGNHFGDPFAARVNERTDFTKVSAELTRTQTLFQPWPDASVAVKGLVTGQYSPDVLPPAEKFFLGGPEFTRGFWSGEVTGDSALAWTVELQLNTGLDFHVYKYPIDLAAQFYAFYDNGETWESQPQDPNHRLSSFGGGLRLNVTRFTEFDLEGLTRFTRTPQGTQGNVLPLHADAIYWRVLTRF